MKPSLLGETLQVMRLALPAIWMTIALLLQACGDVSLFFVSNPGVFETVANQGSVIIVVREAEDPEQEAESVTIVRGVLPTGMELFATGTLEGEPVEAGLFEFTAHWFRFDGVTEEQDIRVNVTD